MEARNEALTLIAQAIEFVRENGRNWCTGDMNKADVQPLILLLEKAIDALAI